MLMNDRSMAYSHARNMAPLDNALVQGARALVVVNFARRLQDRYLPKMLPCERRKSMSTYLIVGFYWFVRVKG